MAGAHCKPGRVILLKQTEQIKNKYKIKEPRDPMNRVIAQKSMFVRPLRGFIEQEHIKTVCVKAELKESILTYLRKYHGIYTQTIYNDLEGYIKHQKNYREAYSEYGRGQLSRRNNPGPIVSVNGNPYDDAASAYMAIEHFNKAIRLYPDFVEAYYARAEVYLRIDVDKAIKDYTSTIELDLDYASAYVGRGLAYRCKGCYDRAIEDFRRAIELGNDNARELLKETQARRGSEDAGEVESVN